MKIDHRVQTQKDVIDSLTNDICKAFEGLFH